MRLVKFCGCLFVVIGYNQNVPIGPASLGHPHVHPPPTHPPTHPPKTEQGEVLRLLSNALRRELVQSAAMDRVRDFEVHIVIHVTTHTCVCERTI